MKIATVSCREGNFPLHRGKITGNVNDFLGSWCFGSRTHISLQSEVSDLKDYDVVWFTMYKGRFGKEKRWMELLYEFKTRWPQKKVILHQEAEIEFYLNAPWNIQGGWIEVLKDKVDLLLAHNERDAEVYRCFVERGVVEVWKTVQDIEKVLQCRKNPNNKDKVVGISSYDGRANGVLGVAVASRVTNNIMQITRTDYSKRDNRNELVNKRFGVSPKVTPMSAWQGWLNRVADLYVYLHPMTAVAAGRDTIACAGLGVPVIGNKHLDEQMFLFPALAVDAHDTRKMEGLLSELLRDERFYERVRSLAINRSHWYDIECGVERAEKMLAILGWTKQ